MDDNDGEAHAGGRAGSEESQEEGAEGGDEEEEQFDISLPATHSAEEGDEEEEQFDISLPATHSYMGGGLSRVRGGEVVEAGWEGEVAGVLHHGAVFPGETVPMLLPPRHSAPLLLHAIHHDKLFALLCPDESGTVVSGYGVLCEVYEAALEEDAGAHHDEPRLAALSFKARAVHRVRAAGLAGQAVHAWGAARRVRVRVLPEKHAVWPLHAAALPSLHPYRSNNTTKRLVGQMEAALTSWPRFVYEIFDYQRMRTAIHDYFHKHKLGALPEEPVSLSFWVASNLALTPRDRLALLAADHALLRLHMELALIAKKSALRCRSCKSVIARRDHLLPMTSDGLHANFTNLSGYMHDIMTVSRVSNVELSGSPSSEFSWFPGYTWTIALCAVCMAHIGWRFDAERPRLRPARFYGLCRNYVQPRGDQDAPLLRRFAGSARWQPESDSDTDDEPRQHHQP